MLSIRLSCSWSSPNMSRHFFDGSFRHPVCRGSSCHNRDGILIALERVLYCQKGCERPKIFPGQSVCCFGDTFMRFLLLDAGPCLCDHHVFYPGRAGTCRELRTLYSCGHRSISYCRSYGGSGVRHALPPFLGTTHHQRRHIPFGNRYGPLFLHASCGVAGQHRRDGSGGPDYGPGVGSRGPVLARGGTRGIPVWECLPVLSDAG